VMTLIERKKFYNMFSRFDIDHKCVRQREKRTDGHNCRSTNHFNSVALLMTSSDQYLRKCTKIFMVNVQTFLDKAAENIKYVICITYHLAYLKLGPMTTSR